jgi:hypothetical protein
MKMKGWLLDEKNGSILDENKGVDIGSKQTSGFWMKMNG